MTSAALLYSASGGVVSFPSWQNTMITAGNYRIKKTPQGGCTQAH